jgi:hypothetical protein
MTAPQRSLYRFLQQKVQELQTPLTEDFPHVHGLVRTGRQRGNAQMTPPTNAKTGTASQTGTTPPNLNL